jgi:hypothetical protein
MKLTHYLLLLTFGCPILNAQLPTTISEEARGFSVNSRHHSFIRSSEYAHGKCQLFGTAPTGGAFPTRFLDREKSILHVNWQTGKFKKYSVVYPSIDEEARAFYKAHLKNSILTSEADEMDGNVPVWTLSLPEEQEKELFRQNWFLKPEMSLENLKINGIKILRQNFNQFAGQLEYLTEEVDYEIINNAHLISEIRLRFARRFKDGIVLGNVAYVYIVLDGRGTFKRAKIKWPRFVESQVVTNSNVGVDPASASLDRAVTFCKEGRHTRVWGDDKTILSKSVAITGAARAWIPEMVDGQIFISPAYSFSVNTLTESGQTLSRYLNVPISIGDGIDDEKFFNVTTRMDATNASGDSAQLLPNGIPAPVVAPVIRTVRVR